MAAAIWTEDNSFALEGVSTFSPRQPNSVSFVYNTEDECEVGLLQIMQREGGRLITQNSGAIGLVRQEGDYMKQVYDCTEIVLTK